MKNDYSWKKDRHIVELDEDTVKRWNEAFAEDRAHILRGLGSHARMADKAGQHSRAGATRDAIMLLTDISRAEFIPMLKACDRCAGTGEVGEYDDKECPSCDGAGCEKSE